MRTHNHPMEPGTETDVLIPIEDGEDITVVGTVSSVLTQDLAFGFGLIEVEFTDPRDGCLKRGRFLHDGREADDRAGLIELAEHHEARAKEIRQIVEQATQ